MSLWQKGRGISRKIKVMLISIALGLAVAVGGIVAAVSLTKNSNHKTDGGIIADDSAITAATSFGHLANNATYKYTHTDGTEKTQKVTTSSADGSLADPWVIDTIQRFQFFINVIDADNATYRDKVFYLSADLDFGGQTITHSAYPVNGFAGKLYGGKHIIKNAVYSGVSMDENTYVMGLISHTATGAVLADFSVDPSCTITRSANISNSSYTTVMGGFIGISTGNIYLTNCSTYANMVYKNTNTTADGAKAQLSMGGFIGYLQKASDATMYTDCVYFRNCNCLTNIDVTGITQPSSGTQLTSGHLRDNGIRYAGVAGTTELLCIEAYYLNINITTKQTNAGGGAGIIFPSGSLNKAILQNCFMKHEGTCLGINLTTDINVVTYGNPVCEAGHLCNFNVDHCYVISNSGNAMFRYGRTDALIKYNKAGVNNNHNHNTLYPTSNEIYAPNFIWNNGSDGYGNATVVGKPTLKSEEALIDAAQKDTSLTSKITVNDDGTGVIKGSAVAESKITYYCGLCATEQVATGKYNPSVNTTINAGHTHTGLKFAGWGIGGYEASGVIKGTIPAYSRMGDLKLYAKWTINAPTETKTNANVIYADAEKTPISVKLTDINTTFLKVPESNIKWTGPDGKAVASTVATPSWNDSTKTATLTFTRPTVAMSGNYTCTYTVMRVDKYNNKGIQPLTRSVTLNLKVSPKVVTAPTLVKNSFVYNGGVQGLQWNPGADGIPKGYPVGKPANSPLYTVGGQPTATNANLAGKVYTVTFTLADNKNYCWATNDTAVRNMTWTIAKASIADGDIEFTVGDDGIVGLPLNGKDQFVSRSAVAKFLFAGSTEKTTLPGETTWKTPSEIISYKDFTEEMFAGTGEGIYKTTVKFTPTDNANINAYEREVTLKVTGQYITVADQAVNPVDGANTDKSAATKIWLDRGQTAKIVPSFTAEGDGKNYATITYYQGGVAKTAKIEIQAPAGYSAKVYFVLGGNENSNGITANSTNSEFTLDFIGTPSLYGREFVVGYVPAEVNYNVYYVLESPTGGVTIDGSKYAFSHDASKEDLDLGLGEYLYKAVVKGTTTNYVDYLDSSYNYFAEIADGEHYDLHNNANKHLETLRIAGDGSTTAVVYLKAQTYVVTFLAVGASNNSTQTQSVKYRNKVNESLLLEPIKKGASFGAWYTAQTGGEEVDLSTKEITGTTTFYAHFISSEYYVVFDMNSFSASADATLKEYGINLNAVLENAKGEKIAWDINTLFGAFGDDFFQAKTPNGSMWNAGDYVFRYTVDNLTSNLSLSRPLPSAISYGFSGWYNASGTKVSTITAPRNISGAPDEVIKLTARWTKQTYRLVFDRQDGSRTTTRNGVANLSGWSDILNTTALSAPTRNGYEFAGWYATPECTGSTVQQMGTSGYFSVYDYADLYGANGVYDFSTIKIYAKWDSVPISAIYNSEFTGGYINKVNITHVDGEPYGSDIVHIGDTVEVIVESMSGYQFSNLVVGKRSRAIYPKAGALSGEISISFTIMSTDVDTVLNQLTISAEFSEVTFTISYDTNGGERESGTVTRTYKISQVEKGEILLPNMMRKKGYDFAGWVYDKAFDVNNEPILDENGDDINGQPAFVTDGLNIGESLKGETLKLSAIVLSSIDGSSEIKWYSNFSLKAKWTPQLATLRLYGARYSDDDNYGDAEKGYYELTSFSSDSGQAKFFHTDETISIKSPVSNSFYFVGWATKRGGDVVYPAELLETGEVDKDGNKVYEAQPVEYLLKASKDFEGNDTKANDLYAVWRVKKISYVNVSASDNNIIYNGTGIKLSARTAREYKGDEFVNQTISINYTWFKVKDNTDGVDHYAACFTVSEKIYLDGLGAEIGKVVYGEENSETYLQYKPDDPAANEDGYITVTSEADITAGQSNYSFIETKTFNTGAIGVHCDIVYNAKRGGENPKEGTELKDSVEWTVKNVRDAGNYICFAELEVDGVKNGSVAFGEINVEMQKATFNGVVFQSAIKPYNGNAQSINVELSSTNGVMMEGNVITLSDEKKEDGTPNGTKITVTYEYRLNGAEDFIADDDGNPVQSVVNAGKYSVTAKFEITDDKGNYEVIKSLSADFEITKRQLTNIDFTVKHEVSEGQPAFVDDGKFSFTYDGNAYVIGAEIKDTDAEGKPIVATTDDLSVEVKIFSTGEDGMSEAEITDNDGNAVNAGNYLAKIVSLKGASNVNYTIGNITLTQSFVINRAKRDYGISFEDAEVTFDNKPHTISIKSNKELPESIKVTYSVAATLEDERLSTYTDIRNKSNNTYLESDVDGDTITSDMANKAITNGGRHAGTYVVTAKFTDSESSNYEPIEVEPATLTIKKADLFKFYSSDGTEATGIKELVTDTGFAPALDLAYDTEANRKRFIGSTKAPEGSAWLLTAIDGYSKPYFDITYNVYRVNADGKRGDGLGSGTEAALSDLVIREPGTYEMEAIIAYASPLYSNDFNAITTNPTIRIKISEGEIESIKVNYIKDVSKVVYVGDKFDMANIANVELKYKNNNTPVILSGTQLSAVKVIYGSDHESFWKVGESVQLVFEVYGTKTSSADGDPLAEINRFKVIQKITDAVLQYSQDGTKYADLPEHGLDVEEANTYQYRIRYNCINENGVAIEKTTEVTAKNLVRGINDNVTELTATADDGTQSKYYALTLADETLYDFSELEFSLIVYKSISANDVTWKYLTDDGWEDIDTETWTLPYKGAEYEVRAYFTGEGNTEAYAETSVEQGSIRNYQTNGYRVIADEYTDGADYTADYKYYRLNGIQIDRLVIARYTLSFVWENDSVDFEKKVYQPGVAQRITLVKSGVLNDDLEDIGFEFTYEKLIKNADGEVVERNPVSAESIIDAGNYRIITSRIVILSGGDESKLSNYILPEDNGQEFVILKAKVQVHEIYYEESVGEGASAFTYGKNVSYENNPQGLRTDKLVIDWGSYSKVSGKLNFVYKDEVTGEYKVYANDSDISKLLKVASSPVQIQYMYSPSDKANYEILYGTVSIAIETQVPTNRLKVVRKEGTPDYYIVDQLVSPDRVEAYREYSSYYIDGGKEYGYSEKVDSKQYLVKANGQELTGDYRYKVTDGDLRVLIEVELTNGQANGSLEFRVFASQPTSLTLAANQTIKNIWYVGESFNLGDLTFNLHFSEGDVVPITFAEMEYSFNGVDFYKDNYKFTIDDADAGSIKVVFRYAGLTTNDDNCINITVKAKEDLQIVTDFSKTKTVKYTGEEIAVPVLEFMVDGAKVTEIEGVSYTTKITKLNEDNGQYEDVSSLKEEGTYRVVYTFNTMTNPRFRDITIPFTLTVDVKKVAYEVVFNEVTEAQRTSEYTGVKVVPDPAKVSKVLDLVNNNAERPDLPVTVRVTSVNGITDSAQWNIQNVGTYEIETTAFLNGEAIGTTTYTYEVKQAKNSATLTVKNIVVGEEVSYEVTDLIFGGPFNASTMIRFSPNGESGWVEDAPTKVGKWYVKLEVEGTTNYARLIIVKEFTISNKNLSSDKDNNGDVMVDVDGGDKGIAPGTVLGVSKVDEETLGGLKIKNQNVHDGYDVTLKDAAGNDAQLDGDLTIKLLLNEDLRVLENKLGVYIVTVDENGKTRTEEIKNVTKSEDGKYLVFSASSVGRFVITEKIPTAPGGLIAGVSVGAVVAAGLIVACVLVFLKKRK